MLFALYFHQMINWVLKIWVRLALPFFVRKIIITGKEQLACKGPLVLAVNHPNSFLDAILVGVFMHHPVHFLSRGDVFRNRWVRGLLASMNMLPVYRIRDGKDKLSLNDQTFERSREVLAADGILLVFVEGFCEHQTTLQLPLKKGAPRVIDACWRQGVPVDILPVWLRYDSFTGHPKHISMHLGELITKPEGIAQMDAPLVWQRINEQTERALKVLEHKASDTRFGKTSAGLKLLLHLPALLAAVLHAPLYLPVKALIKKATQANVHYDSSLFAALLLLYPPYLILLGFLLAGAAGAFWFFFPIIILPALARCYVGWK
jgi:1-acyl-sn-glycerol-3-phosphate acyltransferase